MGSARRWLFVLVLAACRTGAAVPSTPDVCNPQRIREVRVTGASRQDVAALVVLEGAFDDAARTERMRGEVTHLLHQRGYLRATLAVREERDRCGVRLAVAATLGPRYRIARLETVGGDAFPAAARRAWLASDIDTVNREGGTFREDQLAAALDALVRTYQERGWLLAKIAPAEVHLDHARAEVHIRITIDAGPRFRIGAIRASDEVKASLAVRSGDWFDAWTVRAAIDRAHRVLGRALWLDMTHAARGVVDLAVDVSKDPP